jgi:penicillin amidase
LTVLGTGTGGPDQFEQVSGASYRYIVDLEDLDRSVATSAPGQSGQAASPHFNDLAPLWAGGQYFPLSFGRSAVARNAEATLVLAPRR